MVHARPGTPAACRIVIGATPWQERRDPARRRCPRTEPDGSGQGFRAVAAAFEEAKA